MKIKKTHLTLTLILTLTLTISLFADVPSNYYDGTDGLSGETLREKLRSIVTSGHLTNSYGDLYGYYQSTDNYTNGKVWDMYSMKNDGTADYWYSHNNKTCGNYQNEGDCYNREHSVPQSWFGSASPMKADLFIVVPSDGKVNGWRSNYPYGETDSPSLTTSNGSKVGSCSYSGYGGTIFEPIDRFKGDFARMYFYVATRYKNQISSWGGESFSGNDLSTWTKNMLLEWAENDPVSDKELDRNDNVYDIQHNANPFVDHPEFITYIWGGATPSDSIAPVISNIQVLTDSTTANITWKTDENADSKVFYGTNISAMSDSVTKTSFETNHDLSITDLSFETKYYFQVNSTDDDNNGPTFSAIDSFITYADSSISYSTEYENSFETDISDWITYSVASDKNWNRQNTHTTYEPQTTYDGEYYMLMNNYSADVASNDWLISPEIDAGNYDSLYFSFYSWTRFNDTNPGLEVKISTNYSGSGNPSSATWQTISTILPGENSQTWTYSEKNDLSDYNSTIYIAFNYTSTGTGSGTTTAWAIDNYEVFGYSTSAISEKEYIVKNFKLNSPYPNPFNPTFTIPLQLNENSFVNIELVNILGQKVKNIRNTSMNAGEYNLQVNCENLTSGIYFVKVRIDNVNEIQKVILLK